MHTLIKKFHSSYRKARVSFLSSLVFINQTPIFALGNQKSGTTAIAALLANYAEVSVTLDIRGIYEPVQTQLHAGDMTFAEFVRRNRYHFSRDIVKEPCLTFLYPSITEVFPRAKFLMVVRDPRDNIRSILNRLNIPGNLDQLNPFRFDALTPEWQLAIDGRWLGLTGSNYIEMLSARWNLAIDVYNQHGDSGILLIRYEDFVADKVSVISSLAHRLHLPQVNDISSKVDIQYQPRGNREVSWEQFFGPENLARIERVCGSRMERLGYRVREA